MEISREQNVASYFTVPLIDAASRPSYKASPTLAAGDVKVIRHTGGAWNVANIGTLPSAIAGATTQLIVTLTATELNPDDNQYPVIVQFIDQTATKEWDDQTVIIHTRAVPVNLKQINDLSVVGNLATLTLKQLDIQNSAGDAIKAVSSGGNGAGIYAGGHGSQAGIYALGGATNAAGAVLEGQGTGAGLVAVGGTGNAPGIEAIGHGSKHGIHAYVSGETATGDGIRAESGAGATGDGIRAEALSTNGNGINGIGKGSGPGVKAIGGATGPGVRADGGGSNANGIEAYGVGSGNGMQLNAGLTGNGLKVLGGATSGAAIRAIGQAGNAEAMLLEGQGSASGLKTIGGATGHGIHAESGAGASGNGIHAVSNAVNGTGIYAYGSNEGILFEGAAAGGIIRGIGTGYGLVCLSGAAGGPSCAGLLAQGQGGAHGLMAMGASNGHGIYAQGEQGAGGVGHGIYAEGGYDGGSGLVAVSGFGATGDGIRAESQATDGNGIMTIKTGTGIDLHASDHSDGSWADSGAPLTAQETRDAMKLAPAGGAPAAGSVDKHLDDIQTQTDLLPDGFKKNTAVAKFEFEMVQAADHITPSLGAVITAQRSIDGGAYGPCSNAASEVGLGTYTIDFSAADLNGDVITFKFSAPACDTRSITIKTNT